MARKWTIAAVGRTSAVLLLVLAVLCASCAYYNTFFFANKSYKQAERARKDRVDDTPTSQEISFYEKCIKQCSKVIAEYPNSKYVDDAMFLMATSFYYWGRYNESMDWYGQLEESYPESELIREARYMTGRCHLALHEYVDAENILTQLLGSAEGKERDKIVFALAEVGVNKGGMEDAVRHLRTLLEGDASDELVLEANMALGDAYFTSGAYDSAAISYEQVAKRSGKKEQRVEARKRMGQAWQARGDYRRALDIYSGLLLTVESQPGRGKQKDTQEAALLLRMGECHNSLGEHDKALEIFGRVMQDFPKTSVAAEAEFLMGYTFEIYYEDLVRAKISYDRVPSHFQRSVFVDEAKRRSEGLGKLQQYLEEDVQKAEEVEGRGSFLSAELNLFQLNKPAKALDVYRGVEKNYPDSPLAPKAAYASAWVLINKLDRVDEGMAEYRRIVEQYPFTEYAEGARRVLGMIPLAAQLEGPPMPKGWTPPDSLPLPLEKGVVQADTTATQGAIGVAGAAGVSDSGAGESSSDTTLAASVPAAGGSSIAPDSANAVASGAGRPDSSAGRRDGTPSGPSPADSIEALSGAAADSASVGGTPADSVAAPRTVPPDSIVPAGSAPEDSTVSPRTAPADSTGEEDES